MLVPKIDMNTRNQSKENGVKNKSRNIDNWTEFPIFVSFLNHEMVDSRRLLIRRNLHPHVVLGQETADNLLHIVREDLTRPGHVVEVDVLGRPIAKIDTIAGHRTLEP